MERLKGVAMLNDLCRCSLELESFAAVRKRTVDALRIRTAAMRTTGRYHAMIGEIQREGALSH